MDAIPTDLEGLRAAWTAGARPSFLLFWGHSPRAGTLGKWCLSQWWPAAFVVDGVSYPTAEHFMMAGKARAFGDEQALARTLASPDPAAAKKAGRAVRGFDEQLWRSVRRELVTQGNLAKFTQNPPLASFLLSTSADILVEASPLDSVWGIGLAEDSEDCKDPGLWRGENLLGFALTDVRRMLREPRA